MNTLAELLLDQLYQLETASDDEVNEDFSVKLMEQAAARLQSLDADKIQEFLKIVGNMADNATDQNQKEYLQDFADNFGLTEALS
jgi:hypothetical protein